LNGQSSSSFGHHPIAFLRIGAFETQDRSPVTEHLIEALHRNAHALGRTLMVHHVPDLDACKVRDVIGDAEGVLIRTSNINQVIQQSVKWLEGVPAVQVLGGDPIDRHWIDHIAPDNSQAGALAADYLIDCGCSKLVFAATSLANGTGKERCMSFVRTASEAGKEVQVVVQYKPGSEKVLERELSGLPVECLVVENRLELIRTLASTNPKAFGLFVPTDLELAMIMPQLQMMGVQLEKDSYFIGCDREGRCLSGLEPMPATLDLHIENIAARSIRRLIQRIKYPNEPLVRIAVSPDLVRPHEVMDVLTTPASAPPALSLEY
jgi:DNA-binding LacI/PurR family transcriptional regulator